MGCTLINHHEDLIESQIPINSRILLTSLSRFAKSLIVLLKYLIFGGKSPEVGPKKPILLDESTGFEALEVVVRVVCVAKMQRRCWSCYHDRRALVYIADPVHRGLQEDAIEIAKHMVSFHFFPISIYPKVSTEHSGFVKLGYLKSIG